MSTTEPIIVPESPLGAQVMAFIRHGLIAVGGYLVGQGVLDDVTSQAAIGAIMTLVPIIWAQVAARGKHKKLVTAADAAPDRVAQVQR